MSKCNELLLKKIYQKDGYKSCSTYFGNHYTVYRAEEPASNVEYLTFNPAFTGSIALRRC